MSRHMSILHDPTLALACRPLATASTATELTALSSTHHTSHRTSSQLQRTRVDLDGALRLAHAVGRACAITVILPVLLKRFQTCVLLLGPVRYVAEPRDLLESRDALPRRQRYVLHLRKMSRTPDTHSLLASNHSRSSTRVGYNRLDQNQRPEVHFTPRQRGMRTREGQLDSQKPHSMQRLTISLALGLGLKNLRCASASLHATYFVRLRRLRSAACREAGAR